MERDEDLWRSLVAFGLMLHDRGQIDVGAQMQAAFAAAIGKYDSGERRRTLGLAIDAPIEALQK